MTAATPSGPPPPPPRPPPPPSGRQAPCCSFQTKLGPPEYRKWRRLHGLQLPLHPQQVAGWVTLFAFMTATFLVLVPALGPDLRTPVLHVLIALFALHLLAHLTALLVDPADAPLRRLKVRTAVPEFDRTKHAHVIENGRCHLCNIKTSGPRTKHCSVCNKCVGRFDHHCKWLNHCVGGRNYAAFLVCVVSAVLTAMVVVGVAVAELVLYHKDPRWLSPWTYVPYNRTVANVESDAYFPNQDTVFLCVVSAVGVLAAVSFGLLLHLCIFHAYISVLGITTYEYIRRYRWLSAGGTPAVPTLTRSKGEHSMLSNGGLSLSRVPEVRPYTIPRSPNSMEVHSNVGTPQDSTQSARSSSLSSARLVETPPHSQRPRTVTFMDTCCAPSQQPSDTQMSGKTPAKSPSKDSGRYVNSILKKSKSMNDTDLEAGQAAASTTRPYTIPLDQLDYEVEKIADDSLCCASLRSSSSSSKPSRSGKSVSNGRARPVTRPGTPRSASSNSLGVSGYPVEVTEYTGCECNPSRIPLGPPVHRYPNGHLRPRPSRPSSGRRRDNNNPSSFISRFCAQFTAPSPRAGIPHPPGGVRRNQVRPTAECPQARIMGQQLLQVPVVKVEEHPKDGVKALRKIRKSTLSDSCNKKCTALPALPQPARRRLQGVSLKELGDVLAYVQNPAPQHQQPQSTRRHHSDPVRRAALSRARRRSSTPQGARPRSPTLSPIHESGLSNPPTPQRPRTKQTPDSESPPRGIIESDGEPDDEEDDELVDSILYIDEDDGTFFTASMSSMSSMTPLSPLTPLTPMTPMSASFPAASWASKDTRAPASAL